ncbi:MAG: U32 family peptidase [Candidatus Lokiarchaeota archaeon]|nr:U32 family peptidase [Candidatus Lokiarchaeota archaeon]
MNLLENDVNVRKNVYDFYGTHDMSFTGSGRPFFLMAKRGKSEIETFINKVHDLNLKFTWLWNGECLGYYKFNSNEQTKARKELDWLDDMNVDYLTVSDPYLAEFVKLYNPKLKLKVSVIAEVNSLTRALEWAKIIGSEGVLTLSIMLNRNFTLLKEIKENVDCDIELLTNDCCLNECPYRFFHYTECSHASQTHDHLEGYYNDWATIACQNQKCFNPEQVLMSKWIQPSDLDKYIEVGIDYFKISGRRYSTKWIFNTLKAYSEKDSHRNLGEIFNGYSFVSDPLILAGNQFSEFSARQEKMGTEADNQGIMLSVPDFDAYLDGDKLGTFIKNFPHGGTRCAENCGVTCFYCNDFTEKAYSQPEGGNTETYKEFMLYLYNYLNTGEMFTSKNERKLKSPIKEVESDTYIGIPWDQEAEEFLNEVMNIIPYDMQNAARKGIGFTAERTAEKQKEMSVNKELLISIIVELVPQPFKRDYIEFLIEKKINLTLYMSDEEINVVKSLPFSYDLASQKFENGKILNKNSKDEANLFKIDTKEEWESYLKDYFYIYNGLPELPPLLKPIAPLLFQYKITDNPEMDYWQIMEEDKVIWGMGEYTEDGIPKVIHKTDFNTIRKVNSGESNPIEATVAGTYFVEGDLAKLMACAPLAPLNGKTHNLVSKIKEQIK